VRLASGAGHTESATLSWTSGGPGVQLHLAKRPPAGSRRHLEPDETPWTGSQEREALIGDLVRGGGMRIAEAADGVMLGALAITGTPQPYVPAAAEPDLYVNLLLVSRRHSGQGIGAALIGRTRQEAAARGIGLIRVDCWAGEDGSLVRVYERYGFSRVREFTVALPAGPWPGILLVMQPARQ
jgi:GNAT superfamily N-acetyltransferase